MLIEGLRTDSLMIGSLRVSQLVGLTSCILGIALMIYFAMKAKRSAQASAENYTPVYEAVTEGGEESVSASEEPSATETTPENKGE